MISETTPENEDPISIIDFKKGDGLVAAIAQDDTSGEILMVAYMNEESLRRTLETGRRNDTYTEILAGVAEGDTIALVAEERVPFNFFAMGGPPMQ